MGAPLTGERKIVWLVLGFAVFGVALVREPMYAAAQILDPPSRAPDTRRPQLRPSFPSDSALEEEDRRAFDDGRFGPGESAPGRATAPPASVRGLPRALAVTPEATKRAMRLPVPNSLFSHGQG